MKLIPALTYQFMELADSNKDEGKADSENKL